MENIDPQVLDSINQKVSELINKYSLDEVSMRSLVRASIEIDNNELSTYSIILPETGSSKASKSIKLKNIRFSLKTVLSLIFSGYAAFGEKEKALLIAMLVLMQQLITEASVDLDEQKTFVVYAIFYLDYAGKGVSIDELKKYIQSQMNGELGQDIARLSTGNESLLEILNFLEKNHIVAMEEEKYRLIEMVVI